MSDPWVRVETIKGGHVVFCTLCGRKLTRRRFMAEDTNYAEALRLATAYAATHRLGEMHEGATRAFHAEPKPYSPTSEEVALAAIFGENRTEPTDMQLRRGAAEAFATNFRRKELGQ